MGKPSRLRRESVVRQMHTLGSETSQYQEEEKAIDGTFFLVKTNVFGHAIETRKKVLAIPLVAASETGIAQTIVVYNNGVVGR